MRPRGRHEWPRSETEKYASPHNKQRRGAAAGSCGCRRRHSKISKTSYAVCRTRTSAYTLHRYYHFTFGSQQAVKAAHITHVYMRLGGDPVMCPAAPPRHARLVSGVWASGEPQ